MVAPDRKMKSAGSVLFVCASETHRTAVACPVPLTKMLEKCTAESRKIISLCMRSQNGNLHNGSFAGAVMRTGGFSWDARADFLA